MKIENLSYDLAVPGAKKAIFYFFIKLSILFTCWYILYFFILGPARIIDRPLTNMLTVSAVKSINFLSPNTSSVSWAENSDNRGTHFIINNKRVFTIGDNCNGIDLMFTYLSVIVLLPYPSKRKIIFCLGGIFIIILANIFRISALYFIFVYKKSAFDFSHHYLFTILMDLLIFYGWLIFIKKPIIK